MFVRSLGNGLWEVHIALDDRIARVLFAVVDGEMVLLNGFIKKTERTSPHAIDIARDRLSKYREEE